MHLTNVKCITHFDEYCTQCQEKDGLFNLKKFQTTETFRGALIDAMIKVYIPLIWTTLVLYQTSQDQFPSLHTPCVSSYDEKACVLQTAKQYFAPRFQVPFEEITSGHESILFSLYPTPLRFA